MSFLLSDVKIHNNFFSVWWPKDHSQMYPTLGLSQKGAGHAEPLAGNA